MPGILSDQSLSSKKRTPFVEDFSKVQDLNKNWQTLSRAWGGANGGVLKENVYLKNGVLILEAHGDLYSGSLQGVEKDGKPKWHGDPEDPKFGQPWTHRVGGCISLREKTGYGSYRITARIAQVIGVASAFWTFHYDEVYPGDLWYDEFKAEQLHEQGQPDDGFYIVRNHEIDIEFPSHLKDGDLISPSLSNMKCSTWRGELKNWHVSETDPAYWEEYHTELVPCLQNMADGLFHEYRIDWHNDRVEFFIDGSFKHIIVDTPKGDSIPDIPGNLTFGVWFPSSALSLKPWLVDPAKGWAGGVVDPADDGQKANFAIERMEVSRVEFIPFDEPGERLIP